MEHNGYQVTPYRSEFKPQVADLMQSLWGGDPASNLAHFEWKYEDNPHTDSPLGIVALQGRQVVGFRGYFAARFQVGQRNDGGGTGIVVLRPGDTCVDPDHRRTGLSVAMGNLAMEEYADRYPLFLNLSCTKNSLPGYQRMGFLPLSPKTSVARSGLFGLARYILAAKEDLPLEAGKFASGRSGSILVSDVPRPEEMAAIVTAQDWQDARIRLYQDAAFFRWRYNNQRKKYLFYYLVQHGVHAGYLVLGLSPNNRRGYILDYGGEVESAHRNGSAHQNGSAHRNGSARRPPPGQGLPAKGNGSAVHQILTHIIKARQFDVLSIASYCVAAGLGETLKALGFRANNPVRLIEKRLHGEPPVLVRPVKRDFAEDDLLIEGVDASKIDNWLLKPICSDAV